MHPDAFIAEVYRRMSARHATEKRRPDWRETENDVTVQLAAHQYLPYLPKDKAARILDSGADFGIAHKKYVRDWAPDRITLYEIQENIGEFLSDKKEQYDFIHMSHVIEHIPKYSLLWVVDSLYWALKPSGAVLLRTPNMEGPCANSSLYVTLAHEYGFAASNLISLLDICGFDEIRLLNFRAHAPTLKQRAGNLLRWPILKQTELKHRLFGVNQGRQFGSELIAIGKRGDWPPYFDRQYR
jgi:hypothetical protein